MSVSIGQTVQVNPSQSDEETGISIAGWTGRVTSIDSKYKMVELEWDSPTLLQMPDKYVRQCIDNGYDYLSYNIELSDIEVIPPKDTIKQVVEVQKQLGAHYLEYELEGKRPLPFSVDEREGIEENNWNAASNIKKQPTSTTKNYRRQWLFCHLQYQALRSSWLEHRWHRSNRVSSNT